MARKSYSVYNLKSSVLFNNKLVFNFFKQLSILNIFFIMLKVYEFEQSMSCLYSIIKFNKFSEFAMKHGTHLNDMVT